MDDTIKSDILPSVCVCVWGGGGGEDNTEVIQPYLTASEFVYKRAVKSLCQY